MDVDYKVMRKDASKKLQKLYFSLDDKAFYIDGMRNADNKLERSKLAEKVSGFMSYSDIMAGISHNEKMYVDATANVLCNQEKFRKYANRMGVDSMDYAIELAKVALDQVRRGAR